MSTSKELTLPEQAFVEVIVNGGSIKEAGQAAGTTRDNTYKLYKRPHIQEAINEELKLNKLRIRSGMAKGIDKAIKTIILAVENPAFTKTQLQAAQLVLKYSGGDVADAEEKQSTSFEVIINNNTSDNAVDEQQARHRVVELKQFKVNEPFQLIEGEE